MCVLEDAQGAEGSVEGGLWELGKIHNSSCPGRQAGWLLRPGAAAAVPVWAALDRLEAVASELRERLAGM
jgi:hypothetical protein